jgi:uncharacterized protein with GYD domain
LTPLPNFTTLALACRDRIVFLTPRSPYAPGIPARRHSKARYLFQASYTSEAWEAQVSHLQNRSGVIRPVIERLGGRLESAYLSFGDYDVVVIAEMPDSISAAAF